MENTTVVINEEGNVLDVDRIIYNGRTTIVYWNDGKPTRSTAASGERFDPEVGFMACVTKKVFGKSIFGKKLMHRMLLQKSMGQDVATRKAVEVMKDSINLRYEENRKKKAERKNRK